MPGVPLPLVLVVDDDATRRSQVAAWIQAKYSREVVQAGSPAEANAAIGTHHFDIVFFGHPAWEEGVLLYIDMLNLRKAARCQFFLFMDDPSAIGTAFAKHLTVIAKPHWEQLVAAADWTGDARWEGQPRAGL